VLATNLLVLLACKQYSTELNVLNSFTSRTRARWSTPAPRTTNSLLQPPEQQQQQHTNPLGLPRVVRHVLSEERISVDRYLPVLLFQPPRRVRHGRCRRSLPSAVAASFLQATGWALPVRERLLSRVRGPIRDWKRGKDTHKRTRTHKLAAPVIHAPLGARRRFNTLVLLLHTGGLELKYVFCHPRAIGCMQEIHYD